MGELFRYIADKLPAEASETCPGCERVAPLYPFLAKPDGTSWFDDDSDEDEAFCGHCIKTMPLPSLGVRGSERTITKLINDFYKKGSLSGERRQFLLVERTDALRRTPQLPLFLQAEDWPFCCADFCEYQGTPPTYQEAIEMGRKLPYWEYGPADFEEIFGMTLQPEVLEEVCLFQCLTCKNQMFTWQMT